MPGSARLVQLEGIRGLGVFFVIACHFQMLFVPGYNNTLYAFFSGIFPGHITGLLVHFTDLRVIGNMFLYTFWALSGYVIFKPFFEENITISLPAAIIKRYLRLMIPCAVSIFFAYALLSSGLMFVHKILPTGFDGSMFSVQPSFFTALKTSVWNTLFHFSGVLGYNQPLWTIEKEFYGTVLCLVLFSMTFKLQNRYIYYAGLFLCVFILKLFWLNSFLLGYILSDYDFYFRPASADGAGIQRSRQAGTKYQLCSGVLFLLLYTGSFITTYQKPHWQGAVNVLLSILLLLAALRIRVVGNITGSRVLAQIGAWSFGLYALHTPVMTSFSSILWLKLPYGGGALAVGILFIATLIVCILLSIPFTLYVDRMAIRLAAKAAQYFSKEAVLIHEPRKI